MIIGMGGNIVWNVSLISVIIPNLFARRPIIMIIFIQAIPMRWIEGGPSYLAILSRAETGGGSWKQLAVVTAPVCFKCFQFKIISLSFLDLDITS